MSVTPPPDTAASASTSTSTSPSARAAPPELSLIRQALLVPNLLSLLRLAGVPVFLWLVLGPRLDYWALGVLVFGAVTDWLDGKLARLLNQSSRLGELLDPAADRLYILATLIAFLVRDLIPWWVVALLVARELIVGLCLGLVTRRGFEPFQVTYAGKAATFVLMYAFPFLLLTQASAQVADFVRPIGYAFTIWGVVLYLWSGLLYVIQTIRAISVSTRAPKVFELTDSPSDHQA